MIIVAVDNVDVLFVGPLDLSVNMGIAQKFEHHRFHAALDTVVNACCKSGKAAGILLARPEQIEQTVKRGFTFVALGSDGGLVAEGMRRFAGSFEKYK